MADCVAAFVADVDDDVGAAGIDKNSVPKIGFWIFLFLKNVVTFPYGFGRATSKSVVNI